VLDTELSSGNSGLPQVNSLNSFKLFTLYLKGFTRCQLDYEYTHRTFLHSSQVMTPPDFGFHEDCLATFFFLLCLFYGGGYI